MDLKGKIREAREEDIDGVYELCKKVELRNDPKAMAENGFLIAAYTRHPEEKEFLRNSLGQSIFLVYEENKSILGFILGYSCWDDPDEYGTITWDTKKLERIGITDINELLSENNVAYLYQIAVDPFFSRKGISRKLEDYFFRILKRKGIDYVFTEIIEATYDGNVKNPLGIKNQVSIDMHQKIGAVKVGYVEFCYLAKTFLDERGLFSYGIYLINLIDYFKS